MLRNVAAPEIVQAARRFFSRSPVPVFRNGDALKPVPLIPISVAVSAPHGISECMIPPDFFAAAECGSLELVFADASAHFVDQSRPGLKHVNVRGAGIFEMIQAGVACASNEWILVIEDHGRPLPGLLETYRAAIAANPEIDLVFGGIDNATSVSPWSFACFFYNKADYWPPAGLRPKSPSLANLMVRRTAILPSELAQAGGFQFGTYPRLLAAGQVLYCPEAVLDHIRWFSFRSALAASFHGARAVTAQTSQGRRVTAKRLLRDVLIAAYGFTYLPWRVTRSLRGTPQASWIMGLGWSRSGWRGRPGCCRLIWPALETARYGFPTTLRPTPAGWRIGGREHSFVRRRYSAFTRDHQCAINFTTGPSSRAAANMSASRWRTPVRAMMMSPATATAWPR